MITENIFVLLRPPVV